MFAIRPDQRPAPRLHLLDACTQRRRGRSVGGLPRAAALSDCLAASSRARRAFASAYFSATAVERISATWSQVRTTLRTCSSPQLLRAGRRFPYALATTLEMQIVAPPAMEMPDLLRHTERSCAHRTVARSYPP